MNSISKSCLNAISQKTETSKTVRLLKGRFGYFPRAWSIALNWSSYATNESDTEEVDRVINFFIPDIEKFLSGRESQRDQNPSLPTRSLDVRQNSQRRERLEAIVLQIGLKSEEEGSQIAMGKVIWVREGAITGKRSKELGVEMT